jgi:hypothetical protein
MVQRLIRREPTIITINRQVSVPRAGTGGRNTVRSDHGPFTVRIYEQTARIPLITGTDPGTLRQSRGWAMVGGPELDVRATHDTTDTFTDPQYGTFLVTEVRPLLHGTQVIGHIAELTRQ